jgi:hypothetical protein
VAYGSGWRVLWLIALVVGCSGAGHSARLAVPLVQVDTFMGTIHLADSDSSAPVDLVPSTSQGEMGGRPVKLIGAPTLRSVSGLRVRVVGTQANDRRWVDAVTVLRFTVIGLKREPAIDGRLAEDAGTLYIVAPDGSYHTIEHPPPDLRAHLGARVWVAGSLDRAPVAYGIIEP